MEAVMDWASGRGAEGAGCMTRDELIEKLADIEHQRWSDWQKYMHDQGVSWDEAMNLSMLGDELILPSYLVNGWTRQIETPYADLSEREKESDREQVMRYWPLMVGFVAQWLEPKAAAATGPFGLEVLEGLVESWLKAMGDANTGAQGLTRERFQD